jgi:hypothetical protein
VKYILLHFRTRNNCSVRSNSACISSSVQTYVYLRLEIQRSVPENWFVVTVNGEWGAVLQTSDPWRYDMSDKKTYSYNFMHNF